MITGEGVALTGGPLPRVVHRIWIGGPEPAWLAAFADTWQQPGWELQQWHDGNVADLFPLVNQRIWDDAEMIAPHHVGQLRSDVLRYEILLRFGGLYVDADFECLVTPDEWVPDVPLVATWEEQDTWIANGLMGAVPGHPFIAALIAGLPRSVEENPKARPAQVSGPRYLTRMHQRHPGNVTVLPQHRFYPYSYRDVARHPEPGRGQWPDCWAVHHWHNRRRERGMVAS